MIIKVGCISFPGLNYFCNPKSIIGTDRKSNTMRLAINGKWGMALLSAFSILTFSGCSKTTVQQTNQVFSAVYTVAANQWTQGIDPNGNTFYFASLSVPELTQSIDVNGGVEAYLSFDDSTVASPTYEAMPEVFDGVAYGVLHTTGSVTVDLRGADGSSLTSAISAPTLIKVVLLEAQPLGN
jgi:hypothetical protein